MRLGVATMHTLEWLLPCNLDGKPSEEPGNAFTHTSIHRERWGAGTAGLNLVSSRLPNHILC